MTSLHLSQLKLSIHIPTGRVPKATPQRIEQVREWGFLEPMLVRPLDDNLYEILSHFEHFIVAGHLLIDQLPVQIRDDLSDDQARHIVQSQFQSDRMNPIEEAEWFYRRLNNEDLKITQSTLARMRGVSRSYIAKSFKLLSLPTDVTELIRTGELGAGQGRALFRLPTPAKQQHASKYIIKHQLSARRAERYCNALLGKDEPKKQADDSQTRPTGEKSADLERLEKRVSDLIGSPFAINDNGTVTIQYFGKHEILDGLLMRLGYREEF